MNSDTNRGDLFPSINWETEKQGQYREYAPPRHSEARGTSCLDTRKHSPQSRKLFRIKGINKKPICTVDDQTNAPTQESLPANTVYMTTYTERKGGQRELIHRADAEAARLEHCIVPLNDSEQGFGVKPEMMLPVCDPGFMPSAKEPHKYLARKRRVPPPYKSCGVVYPNLEYPRMTAYVPGKPRDGADIPFDNEDLSKIPDSTERVSVTSLTGLPFTRRRFLSQKEHGVIPGTVTSESNQDSNGLLPYMRAKAII